MSERYKTVRYPLGLDADPTDVRQALGGQYKTLVSLLPFEEAGRIRILETLKDYYIHTEALAMHERRLRREGDARANLVYHNFDHFVQAGFDGTAAAISIKRRNDYLASHLSPEGMVAVSIASLMHDIGEITASPLLKKVADKDLYYTDESFPTLAHHKPVHVRAGIDYFGRIMDEIGLPGMLDRAKVTELGMQGIHNTAFPWNEDLEKERQLMLSDATPEQWKEAMIVRLIVQLADLGGQSVRKGQIPQGLKLLREEENSIKAGEGTKLLGTDEQLIDKTRGFIRCVLIPKMGRSANALLGRENHYLESFLDTLDFKAEGLSFGEVLRLVNRI